MIELVAPVKGAVVAAAAPGDRLAAGQAAVMLESMKMEVPVAADRPGTVASLLVSVGEAVEEGQLLARIDPAQFLGSDGSTATDAQAVAHGDVPAKDVAGSARSAGHASAPGLRPELALLQDRRALLADAARPDALERRHASGLRTARENLDDLLDAGSFSEYGAFAVAAQRSRRSEADLQRHTPADGLITGIGTVDGRAVAVMAYDYTVLAGTQGVWNHAKADRLLELAHRQGLPLVLFAEGGGGRPGDVDWHGVAGLDCTTFARLAALSGQVPTVGIVAGRCFAGNAALLGCCDLVIAVEGASIGLGGPAMIEGGGLGRVEADAVGPVDVLDRAGAVDVRVTDEAAAVAAARRWLAMVAEGPGIGSSPRGGSTMPRAEAAPSSMGSATSRSAARPGGDLQWLRRALPERRNALYDPRQILRTVADEGSVMELRAGFGAGLVTAVARLGGTPVALAASHPLHLGGALDAPACDKLVALMQRADAMGWPLISFVDTPGFMVGPDSEATGMVRKAGRLFVHAAALRVPVLTVLLRRGFGLGAMALAAGHFHAPLATCAWPGGEFGPMGLEGAVRLGFRKELQAEPEATREALFQRLLAQMRDKGGALNMASHLEIDDVIDPAETRDWLLRHLAVAAQRLLPPRRAVVDPF